MTDDCQTDHYGPGKGGEECGFTTIQPVPAAPDAQLPTTGFSALPALLIAFLLLAAGFAAWRESRAQVKR